MTQAGGQQISKNLLMNIISFIINISIGLWLVPYLVGHLGTAAYGLVPLAMVFTQFVSVITGSFNAATGRFLTVSIQGKDLDGAISVFNGSLLVIFAFVVIQALVSFAMIFNLEAIIQIPNGLYLDTVWLFGLTFTGFLFSMLSSIFSISMYSHNRVDLMRINDISRVIVRVFTIVILFISFGPGLIYVGIGNLVGGLVLLFLSIRSWLILTPELKIRLRTAEFKQFRPMVGMATWVLINQVGYLLFLRIDTYVINRFIGPEACGEYTAVQQWNELVRAGAGVLSGAITPLGTIYYARGEIEKLIGIMKLAVKFMGLAIAAPVALLCVFSEDILAIWLGEDFRKLGSLLTLQLAPLVINLGVLPLFTINSAFNKVKIPAILTIILGVLNFLLAVVFTNMTNWGYYGVAIAGVVALTMKNLIFTPLYAAHILHLPKYTFLRSVCSGGIAFLLVFSCATAIWKRFQLENLFEIGLAISFSCLGSGLIIAWTCLSSNEKEVLVNLVPLNARQFAQKVLLVK
jgi:membrane protein EpsK